ncbi:MAG TPA: SCP2 sterol-binding domain-containing protein [Bacteroidetes bacterium]|nr:SCP2 sterol-binding domain-containing protein [Bacteroidota bacterium]
MDINAILEGIKKSAAGADPIGNTLKFVFDGDEVIFIDGTASENVVSLDDNEADCQISLSKENFIKLTTGDLNPMMAVMTGKVKIKGDMSVAMKLQSLIG